MLNLIWRSERGWVRHVEHYSGYSQKKKIKCKALMRDSDWMNSNLRLIYLTCV